MNGKTNNQEVGFVALLRLKRSRLDRTILTSGSLAGDELWQQVSYCRV